MELFKVGVSVDDSLTDIVFMGSEGTMLTHKIPSTAPDLTQGVATGIKQVLVNNRLGSESITQIVHSTPVAMNTLLANRGVKTGLITTKGFRDVLGMGRGTTPTSFDLCWKKPVPPVPRYLVTEVNERIDAKGEIVHPLDINEAIVAIDKLAASGVESVAVCLLNSVHNPIHEQKIGQLLRQRAPAVHVSLSTEVIPMAKEAERSLEVTINACIAPVVANYMESLSKGLGSIGIEAPFYIMQSCGGLTTHDTSVERPIAIMQGGPASGVVSARLLSNKLGTDDLITFDMGGAWAKASIITEGDFILANEYEVGARIYKSSRLRTGSGYLLRTPAIDIFDLWCGCNSIIWFDAGGMLHVGFQNTDPVSITDCHGRREKKPTLADAYVLLGYLDADCLLGQALKLDSQKSCKVIEDNIARPLGMDPLEAAYRACQIANSNMGRIIATVCAERGRDIHDFALLAFGYSGAIPAADIGQELGMEKVIIPPCPGIFNALGLLFADIERHFIRPFRMILVESTIKDINQVFQTMIDEAKTSVERWGYTGAEVKIDKYADLRYCGQTTEIRLLIPDELNPQQLPRLLQRFNEQHQKLYGFRLPRRQTETVNLRLVASIETLKPALSEIGGTTAKTSRSGLLSERKAYFGKQYGLMNLQVLAPEEVGNKRRQGPLIIEDNDTTIVVPPGCFIAIGEYGSLMITLKNQES